MTLRTITYKGKTLFHSKFNPGIMYDDARYIRLSEGRSSLLFTLAPFVSLYVYAVYISGVCLMCSLTYGHPSRTLKSMKTEGNVKKSKRSCPCA
jgi:hypothetical protein